MKKKIFLFRHGETDWNAEGRIQCTIDIELNEKGIEQAKQNAEFLKNFGIQHVYSSPLKRAYKTGEILAKTINVDIEITDGLKELYAGKSEGMLKSDLKTKFKEYESFFHTRDEALDTRILGEGESKREARNRIYNSVLDICQKTPYDIIGIASHGIVLREFLRSVNFEDDSGLKNCECIEAEFDGKKLSIIRRIKNLKDTT